MGQNAIELGLFHDGPWLREETKKGSQGLTVLAYDENHADRWNQAIAGENVHERTLYTILGVNGEPVPVRWLAHVVETAHMLELLDRSGIQQPKWHFMAPIHISSACNGNEPDRGVKQAATLTEFAQRYLQRYHPGVVLPKLELDDRDKVPDVIASGHVLYPFLPDEVRNDLETMAGKHGTGQGTGTSAAYLLAHYSAYGRVSNGAIPLFPPREGAIYVVPQSEDRFIGHMRASARAVAKAGIAQPVDPDLDPSIVMVSGVLRTPHYYAHYGERKLADLVHVGAWQTRNQLSRLGRNGMKKQQEIAEANRYIDDDIGGFEGSPALCGLVQEVMKE